MLEPRDPAFKLLQLEIGADAGMETGVGVGGGLAGGTHRLVGNLSATADRSELIYCASERDITSWAFLSAGQSEYIFQI